MAPKPPTPQGISRLLKDAGFTRALIARFTLTSGYHVTADRRRTGAVRVEWKAAQINGATAALRDYYLVRYARAVTAAGWSVNPGEYELVVTAAAPVAAGTEDR
jgi:hypothetical protein